MSADKPSDGRRVFLSYSHADREFAEHLAHALHEAGEDVWWDEWELLPGDSLVKKIFEEGLSRAKAFVIVLSPESVKSKWVREELDHATIQRIEGVTRVIPVIKEDTEIPPSLRSLLWLDMRTDFAAGVGRLVNAIHGVSAKPSPEKESIAERLIASFGGLSAGASTVGLYMLLDIDPDSGFHFAFDGPELVAGTTLDARAVNDAVDELEELGAVRVRRAMGTAPYDFMQVEPTYVLFREGAEHLSYDPSEDVRVVASAVVGVETADGPRLQELTGLSPGRLNRAVDYLEDYAVAGVTKWMGTSPYTFGEVDATRRTRQFVQR